MKKLIKKFPNYHERAAFAFDLMKKEFQRGEKSNKIKYLVYDITGLTEVFFNKKIKELKERLKRTKIYLPNDLNVYLI